MTRGTHDSTLLTRSLLLLVCLLLGSSTVTYAQSEVVLTEEADQATIDGASVQQIEGFTYYEVLSEGFIEWPFEVATEGTYDLVLNTRLTSGTKEQHISINGERFKNQAFPSNDAFVFDAEVLGAEWVEYRISPDTIYAPSDMSIAGPEVLTLEAGSHTLRIEASEGAQQFSGFSLVDAASGDTAVTVVAPDAVAEEVIPMCAESDYCPTGFKSVALREGALLRFDILFPESASYQLHIFYNAPNGGFSDLLLDWNVVVDDMNFTSTEGDLLTTPFEAEPGIRALAMDSEQGGFNVDYVQLIKLSDSTATSNEQPTTQGAFSLAQNYRIHLTQPPLFPIRWTPLPLLSSLYSIYWGVRFLN